MKYIYSVAAYSEIRNYAAFDGQVSLVTHLLCLQQVIQYNTSPI